VAKNVARFGAHGKQDTAPGAAPPGFRLRSKDRVSSMPAPAALLRPRQGSRNVATGGAHARGLERAEAQPVDPELIIISFFSCFLSYHPGGVKEASAAPSGLRKIEGDPLSTGCAAAAGPAGRFTRGYIP
jgi:hypothetical protein